MAVRRQRHRRPRRPHPAAHRQRGPQPILRLPGKERCSFYFFLSNLNSSFVVLDRIRHTVVRRSVRRLRRGHRRHVRNRYRGLCLPVEKGADMKGYDKIT